MNLITKIIVTLIQFLLVSICTKLGIDLSQHQDDVTTISTIGGAAFAGILLTVWTWVAHSKLVAKANSASPDPQNSIQTGFSIKNGTMPLLIAVVCLATFTACTQLPVDPTQAQIRTVQDNITAVEVAYTAFSLPLEIEISKPTYDARKRALIQAAEQLIWQELENAYIAAGQGKNVDAHQLLVDFSAFKTKVIQIQSGATPATLPAEAPATRP